ncbi:MAG: cytosine permease [Cytophagales bacterium]|nr:cytosine permease [Cytophagales bacterium]
MSTTSNLQSVMEDHALESVPDEARQGWLRLTWNTAGIVTTLIQLFFGALATFVAGFKLAVMAGIFVTIVGSIIGWLCGHVAYKSGLSSTVMARQYGFGVKGSVLGSAIFAFMIIGFLALENALLYQGFLFYFNWPDTFINQCLIYGLLSVIWVLLTLYGFDLVSKVSSWSLVLFLLLLVYMTGYVLSTTNQTMAVATSFSSILPPVALAGMGASTDMGKFIFCVNLFIGSAGALALVDADIGRYAKSSKDIGIAAFFGNLAMDVLMVVIGGVVMFAGSGKLVEAYVSKGIAADTAQKMALSPDGVAAAFIVFGGLIGFILMIVAQGKAQVLNTYSGSLSLSNLSDAIGLRMPRWVMVVVANLIGLVMVGMNILGLVQSWVNILGVLTTAFAGIMLADYFIIRSNGQDQTVHAESINWAGVITTFVATILAHYVLNSMIPIEFFSSLVISVVLYVVLRKYVFQPR